jgi:hypothetical protein
VCTQMESGSVQLLFQFIQADTLHKLELEKLVNQGLFPCCLCKIQQKTSIATCPSILWGMPCSKGANVLTGLVMLALERPADSHSYPDENGIPLRARRYLSQDIEQMIEAQCKDMSCLLDVAIRILLSVRYLLRRCPLPSLELLVGQWVDAAWHYLVLPHIHSAQPTAKPTTSIPITSSTRLALQKATSLAMCLYVGYIFQQSQSLCIQSWWRQHIDPSCWVHVKRLSVKWKPV